MSKAREGTKQQAVTLASAPNCTGRPVSVPEGINQLRTVDWHVTAWKPEKANARTLPLWNSSVVGRVSGTGRPLSTKRMAGVTICSFAWIACIRSSIVGIWVSVAFNVSADAAFLAAAGLAGNGGALLEVPVAAEALGETASVCDVDNEGRFIFESTYEF